jgi:hypothetical protein
MHAQSSNPSSMDNERANDMRIGETRDHVTNAAPISSAYELDGRDRKRACVSENPLRYCSWVEGQASMSFFLGILELKDEQPIETTDRNDVVIEVRIVAP